MTSKHEKKPVKYWQLSEYLRKHFGRHVDYDPFFHQDQGILIQLGILSHNCRGRLLKRGTGLQTIRVQIRLTDGDKYALDLVVFHEDDLKGCPLKCSLVVSKSEQIVTKVFQWHEWLSARDLYSRANFL